MNLLFSQSPKVESSTVSYFNKPAKYLSKLGMAIRAEFHIILITQ